MSRLFDKTASFSGDRSEGARLARYAVACPCCVMEGGFDEPILESSQAAVRRVVTLVVRKSSWLTGAAPRVGDRVRIDGVGEFALSKVQEFAGVEWVMEAR